MRKNFVSGFVLITAVWVLLFGGAFSSHAAQPLHPPYPSKPWTLLIYMNGSDLESEWGAATDDLVEMLDSGLDSRRANVVILTGGTLQWRNDALPSGECVIWQLRDGHLYEVTSLGDVNMGDAQTLADFLRIGLAEFPARRVGLIMWDHGGGSVAGFGHDERFADGTLTLLEMERAFREAGLAARPLDFLGFDACLMATVEMAVIAAPYAKVLAASQDLAPGDGWDYSFLSVFNSHPNINGADLGRVIGDSFMEFFGEDSDEILTVSVVETARAQDVMDAMGQLANAVSQKGLALDLYANSCPPFAPFRAIAARRARTKTFGEGSPRDNYSDMVDIADMAAQLRDLFPKQADAVIDALRGCVLYNRHNADVELGGLAAFYIYGGKSDGEESLRIYESLGMNAYYTQFLWDFFAGLVETAHDCDEAQYDYVLWQPLTDDTYRMAGLAPQAHPEDDLLWAHINGNFVSLFPAGSTKKGRHYAIPARVNGRDADLIVFRTLGDARVAGARHYDGHVKQKGYDPIRAGDVISFYAREWNRLTDCVRWRRSRPFTVRGELRIEWCRAPAGFEIGDYFPAHQFSAFSNNF